MYGHTSNKERCLSDGCAPCFSFFLLFFSSLKVKINAKLINFI